MKTWPKNISAAIFKHALKTRDMFWALGVLVALCFAGFIFLLFKPTTTIDISDEIQNLSSSVRKHYQKQIDYRGLNTSFAIQNAIVPKQMIRINKIFSKNASEILIGGDLNGRTVMPFEKSFGIIYTNLDHQKCIHVLTTKFDVSSGLTGVTVSNDDVFEFTYGGVLNLPVSQEAAQTHCRAKNTVMFTFE